MLMERRDISRFVIKTALSVAASFIVFKGTEINGFSELCAVFISFGVFYNVCYLYQISLNITRNYFVAIFVFVFLFGGIVFIYDKISPVLSNINPKTLSGELLTVVVVTLILLTPFLFDLFYVIKRSVIVKK